MTDATMVSKQAMAIAAQCWCDDDTKDTVMDVNLAKAFANRVESLLEERRRANNKILELAKIIHDLRGKLSHYETPDIFDLGW